MKKDVNFYEYVLYDFDPGNQDLGIRNRERGEIKETLPPHIIQYTFD